MDQWNVPAPRIPGLDIARVIMLIGALFCFDLLQATQSFSGFGFLTLLVVVVAGFFVISGYHASALLQRAKFRGFIASRLKRLVPILSAGFLLGILTDSWLHLVPLEFLVVSMLLALLLSWLSRRVSFAVRSRLMVYTNLMGFGPIWIGGYGIVIALASGSLMPLQLQNSWGLVYNWRFACFSYLGFSVGWILHRAGSMALKKLANCALIYLVFGAVLVSVASSLPSYLAQTALITGGLYLAFAIIGGLLAFSHPNNKMWSYLAEASLWVYVWQPIVVAAVAAVATPTLVFGKILGGSATFIEQIALCLVATVLVLLSYQLLIRITPLRLLFGGRRRVRVGG